MNEQWTFLFERPWTLKYEQLDPTRNHLTVMFRLRNTNCSVQLGSRRLRLELQTLLAMLNNISSKRLLMEPQKTLAQRKLFVFELFDFIYSNLCHCPAERVLGTSLPNGNVVLRCCRIRRIRDATQNEVASVLVYKTGGQQHWASLLLHIWDKILIVPFFVRNLQVGSQTDACWLDLGIYM